MIEGGGESLQPTDLAPTASLDVRSMVEEIRQKIVATMGLPEGTLPFPAIPNTEAVHQTIKQFFVDLIKKPIGLGYYSCESGITHSFDLRWEPKRGRRVVATYYREDGVQIDQRFFRSRRLAHVESRRSLGTLIVNYRIDSPAVSYIELNCKVNGPPTATADQQKAMAEKLTSWGISDETIEVMTAIAESESPTSRLPQIPKPANPNRPGTLAYWSEMGTLSEWVVCNPSDPFYSTSIMIATHRWGSTGPGQGVWVPIDLVTDEHDQGDTNAAE